MKTLLALLSALLMLLAACSASEPTVEPTDAIDQPADDQAADDLPLGAGPYPIATLNITITHPAAGDVTYSVSCLGDTATVIGDVEIDAPTACLALNDAQMQTRLVGGMPDVNVCTEIYGGPDVATIVGTYGDDTVNTTAKRTNGCEIADWDSGFAGVLPPALGVTE